MTALMGRRWGRRRSTRLITRAGWNMSPRLEARRRQRSMFILRTGSGGLEGFGVELRLRSKLGPGLGLGPRGRGRGRSRGGLESRANCSRRRESAQFMRGKVSADGRRRLLVAGSAGDRVGGIWGRVKITVKIGTGIRIRTK